MANSTVREPSDHAGRPGARFTVLWGTPSDVDAFERHYRTTHLPLATRLPGLRRYTLSRDVSVVRGERPYYLVAELDWDDLAALRGAFGSEIGRRCGADVTELARLAAVYSMTYELADCMTYPVTRAGAR